LASGFGNVFDSIHPSLQRQVIVTMNLRSVKSRHDKNYPVAALTSPIDLSNLQGDTHAKR
jgi:hypothetical protein